MKQIKRKQEAMVDEVHRSVLCFIVLSKTFIMYRGRKEPTILFLLSYHSTVMNVNVSKKKDLKKSEIKKLYSTGIEERKRPQPLRQVNDF